MKTATAPQKGEVKHLPKTISVYFDSELHTAFTALVQKKRTNVSARLRLLVERDIRKANRQASEAA